jgi:hypothetical protein
VLDVLFFPVGLGELSVHIWLHGLGSRSPLGRADFAVLVGILEGLHESDELVNVSAYWQIVVGCMSEDALVIDDESSSKVKISYLLATPASGPLVMRQP